MNMWMKKFTDIAGRIVATFIINALAIISGAAIVGNISVTTSALLAGFTAVAHVVEKLAKASLDGKLTFEEINSAFINADAPKDE